MPSCEFDYVKLFNGADDPNPLSLCGDNILPTEYFVSAENTMLVMFVTDNNAQFPGFIANYKAVELPDYEGMLIFVIFPF